jgi:hypothetical protein
VVHGIAAPAAEIIGAGNNVPAVAAKHGRITSLVEHSNMKSMTDLLYPINGLSNECVPGTSLSAPGKGICYINKQL